MPYDDYHDHRLADINHNHFDHGGPIINKHDGPSLDEYLVDLIDGGARDDVVVVRRVDYDNLVAALDKHEHYCGNVPHHNVIDAARNLVHHVNNDPA